MSEEICKACGKLSTPYDSLNAGGHLCEDCFREYNLRKHNRLNLECFIIMKLIERIEKLESKIEELDKK